MRGLKKSNAVAAVAVLGLAGAGLLLPTQAGAANHAQHVVVIGLDGAMFDRIPAANAPNLDALIAGGYSSKTLLYANPLAPTLSGPGWGTILTGVWPDKHGVKSNSWSKDPLSSYPDFLTRLEQADSSLKTYAASTWTPIVAGSSPTPLITSAVDTRYDGSTDQDTTNKVVAAINNTAPHGVFMQLDDIDIAGHSYGGASQQYLNAISAADAQVGQVLAAVNARPSTETWTVIVTADHGHTDAGGHGGSTIKERSSFIIKDAPGVGQSTPSVPPKNVDIAAEVLGIMGVPAPAVLDGQRLGTASTDPFETVLGSLQTQVDETLAPGIRGWTHAAPSGWTISNTGLGTGGVTEWRGWTFTNDDFWTRIAPNQQRESNVRARGVFAVADSDEWADKTYTGTYNTALTSPSYSVAGRSSVLLRFGSHYLKEGSETARVRVSFDGGAASTVLTYTGDQIAKIESLTINVPSGAQGMKVTFSLTNGNNNWYWAVDNPKVS